VSFGHVAEPTVLLIRSGRLMTRTGSHGASPFRSGPTPTRSACVRGQIFTFDVSSHLSDHRWLLIPSELEPRHAPYRSAGTRMRKATCALNDSRISNLYGQRVSQTPRPRRFLALFTTSAAVSRTHSILVIDQKCGTCPPIRADSWDHRPDSTRRRPSSQPN
jgi:hypothetical protein